MLDANKMLIINEVDDIESGHKLIEKLIRSKTRKLLNYKNCLSPKNWLCLKNCQKIGIYLILTPKKMGRIF